MMLYTLSKANYDLTEITPILFNYNHTVVLWQESVILPLKHPEIFKQSKNIYALETDVIARGIAQHYPIKTISLANLVKLTVDYYPQIGL